MIRILIAFLFFPVFCFAQTTAPAPTSDPIKSSSANVAPAFRFGLKITPTIAWMNPDYQVVFIGETFENTGARAGFNWGANMEVKINQTAFFVTGLEFNYLSAKHKIKIPDSTGSSKLQDYDVLYKMRYLDIPLMLRFRTNLIGNLHYYGLFGGTVGVRIDKDVKFTSVESGLTLIKTEEISEYVNPIRGSINVGLGIEYPLSGNTSFLGSIVYNNGLTNVLKNIDQTESREHAIMSMVQFNLGVLF